MDFRTRWAAAGLVAAVGLSAALADNPKDGSRSDAGGIKGDREKGDKPDKPDKFDRPGKPDRKQRLSDDEALRLLAPLSPEMHARMLEIKDREPREFRERLDRMIPVLERREQFLRNRNPGLADLMWESFHVGEECRELARLYRAAPDDEARSRLAGQLRDKVADQLELEFRHRKNELDEFEKRLARMRRELQEQKERRDKIVQERMHRWTGQKGPPPPKAPPSAKVP
jgi:hypothetical protein